MSSLAERLKEAKAKAKPSIDVWLAEQDAEDRQAWADACADPTIPTAELLRIVTDENVAIGKDAMLKHRRGHGYAR